VETLGPFFKGCDSALIVTVHDMTRAQTNNMSEDSVLTINMINAAAENGVKHIVFVGSFTVIAPTKITIISSRFIPCEALLVKLGKEKGIKWTSLRASTFADNLLMNKDSIKNASSVRLINGHIPLVHTRDIGKSGAACLAGDADAHSGKIYDICGPELLSSPDIAKVFSKVLGREIKWVDITKDEVAKCPPALQEIWTYIMEGGKNALPFPGHVKELTGQNTSFETFVREHLAEFQ